MNPIVFQDTVVSGGSQESERDLPKHKHHDYGKKVKRVNKELRKERVTKEPLARKERSEGWDISEGWQTCQDSKSDFTDESEVEDAGEQHKYGNTETYANTDKYNATDKYKPSYSGQSKTSKRGKKFEITIGSKHLHRWAHHNMGTDALYVNGKVGPILNLTRGESYFFCISQKRNVNSQFDHSIVLSEDPIGVPNGQAATPLAFAPISDGCVKFTVDNTTPRIFFYHCINHPYEGGFVMVHNKQD